MDFESEWSAAYPQLLRYCRSLTRDAHVAEEAAAETGRRAWLGYARFRRDCSFLSWVMGIGRREVSRRLSRKGPPVASLTRADGKAVDPPAPAPAAIPVDWLPGAIADAVTAGELSEAEGVVLSASAAEEKRNWAEVGKGLGLTAANCAVIRLRALGKLRVFLFLHRPQLLGGAARIAAAFVEARNHEGGLTTDQANVFRRMVIERSHGYRTVGWRTALRDACERVIRFLEPDERGPF
jgi:DNA-directed RNA polymerase specialized sigma24 family protein